MSEGNTGMGPEHANPGGRPSGENEISSTERARARDELRNLKAPDDDSPVEVRQEYSSKAQKLAGDAGLLGEATLTSGDQDIRINVIGYVGMAPDGDEVVLVEIDGSEDRFPTTLNKITYGNKADAAAPVDESSGQGERPAPVESGDEVGPEEGDEPETTEDDEAGEGDRDGLSDVEKIRLQGLVEKIKAAKRDYITWKPITDPKTGLPIEGSTPDIPDPMTGAKLEHIPGIIDPVTGEQMTVVDRLDKYLTDIYEKYPSLLREEEANNAESEKEFLERLKEYLRDDHVRAELRKVNPQFTEVKGHKLSKKVNEFKDFIDGMSVDHAELFAHVISGGSGEYMLIEDAEMENKNGKKVPKYENSNAVQISKETRMLLFEWAMNKIVTIPIADEDSPYDLSFQLQGKRDSLKALAQARFRDEGDEEFHARVAGIGSVEQTLHNTKISIDSGSERYQELFASLRTPSLDFTTNKIAGVSEVLGALEHSFLQEVADDKKAMRTPRVKKARKRALDTIRNMQKNGHLRDGDRILNDWEVERAIRLGSTFFRASQRESVYISAGDTEGIAESPPDEYANRQIAPAKWLWWRFWYPKGHEMPASRQFLDLMTENTRILFDEQAKKAKKKRNKETGQSQVTNIDSLMGLSGEEMVRNHYGIFDIASHDGVRGPKLYLTPIKMEGENGDVTTMYEYLMAKGGMTKEEFSKEDVDEVLIRLLGQTSYLSSMQRHKNLSTEARELLWRKRAVIDPLAVTSLRPESLEKEDKDGNMILSEQDKKIWHALRPALEEYHLRNLSLEKKKYSSVLTQKEMKEEAGKFTGEKINEDVRDRIFHSELFKDILAARSDDPEDPLFKILNSIGDDLTEEQKGEKVREVLAKVIETGMNEAEYLAIHAATTRHNYAIDDAPIVAWYDEEEGLSDNNFVRNYGDQANLNKNGYAIWNTAFNDPKSAINGESFDEAVKGFAAVFGNDVARELVEPSEIALMQMLEQYSDTKWLPINRGFLGQPRSDMEKWFGRNGMYWNESMIRSWYEARAFKGTISNRYDQKIGERGLTRVLGRSGVRWWGMWKEKAREDGLKVIPMAILAAIIMSMWNLMKGEATEASKEV